MRKERYGKKIYIDFELNMLNVKNFNMGYYL